VTNPAFVLLDEPMSSLDHALNLHLRGEILRLHVALGFTLVYVTHSRDESVDIDTCVIAMQNGKVHDPSIASMTTTGYLSQRGRQH
jgi:ABC-type sugar transport system ATPase subunit